MPRRWRCGWGSPRRGGRRILFFARLSSYRILRKTGGKGALRALLPLFSVFTAEARCEKNPPRARLAPGWGYAKKSLLAWYRGRYQAFLYEGLPVQGCFQLSSGARSWTVPPFRFIRFAARRRRPVFVSLSNGSRRLGLPGLTFGLESSVPLATASDSWFISTVSMVVYTHKSRGRSDMSLRRLPSMSVDNISNDASVPVATE